jgi:hypothetical protein
MSAVSSLVRKILTKKSEILQLTICILLSRLFPLPCVNSSFSPKLFSYYLDHEGGDHEKQIKNLALVYPAAFNRRTFNYTCKQPSR